MKYNTMEKKRTYVQPRTEVMLLHVTNQLLTGSAGMQDYNWNDPVEESRFFDMEDSQLIN